MNNTEISYDIVSSHIVFSMKKYATLNNNKKANADSTKFSFLLKYLLDIPQTF